MNNNHQSWGGGDLVAKNDSLFLNGFYFVAEANLKYAK